MQLKSPLFALSGLLLIGWLSGCFGPVNHSVSQPSLVPAMNLIPLNETDRSWVIQEVGFTNKYRLVSIYTDWEWNSLTVRVRTLDCDSVRCIESRKQGSIIQRKIAFVVRDPDAVQMWRDLFIQTSHGFKYRSTTWRESSNPSGAYAIALGSKFGITIDEGSEPSPIVDEIVLWRESESDNRSEKFKLRARVGFNREAFPSFSTYLILAIGWLDDLCELLTSN